jgi:excisionase family DNA binding protein
MAESRDSGSRFLTRAEVADIFKVSPSTITRWAEAGKLPSIKTLGGHRRYEAKAVMDLARQLIQIQEVSMEKTTFSVPAMYGDHHVVEVRRILLQISGVEDVMASSAFHTVAVSYNPDKVNSDDIKAKLNDAGYLGELTVPVETDIPAAEPNGREKTFFRHTASYEKVTKGVSFGQRVSYTGQPLWPCPGMGVVTKRQIEPTELQ